MSQPAWTTTLQQDLAALRGDLEKVEEDTSDDSLRATREGIMKAIGNIEAMERKLQVARCNAIGALEAL